MKIFIPGVSGFIGSNLVRRLLKDSSISLVGLDLNSHNLEDKDPCLNHPRFIFIKADIIKDSQVVEDAVKSCDCVIPLAAIANPAIYVQDPLKVFHLDFEANLAIIKMCVAYKKRLIFPSTSEVYGMCPEEVFDEETSSLVLGPTQKSRWIYSCSKQLLDRVIHAYGEKNDLEYTLFRPFNWIGPRLDSIHTTHEGQSRAFSQFLGNALQGKPLKLVDGGLQKRAFIYIDDAIDGLMSIINKPFESNKQVFNIGNPHNEFSIKELAETILKSVKNHPLAPKCSEESYIDIVESSRYFAHGYQDVSRRLPSIGRAFNVLGFNPKTGLEEAIKKTLDFYLIP